MDKMREEFEEWYSKELGFREDNPERMFSMFCDNGENREYYRLSVRCAWSSWKASRDALCVDMPRCRNDELVRLRDELLAALEAHEKFWTIREAELGELSPEAKAVRDNGLVAITAAKRSKK